MGRIKLEFLLIILVSLILLFIIAGCGARSIAGTSALQTGQNIVAALDKGEFTPAAEAFDYDTQARSQNDNWDEIPDGQRKLIIDSMIKDRAAELEQWPSALGIPVAVEESSPGAVTLKGNVSACTLQMVEKDGKWFVGEVYW